MRKTKLGYASALDVVILHTSNVAIVDRVGAGVRAGSMVVRGPILRLLLVRSVNIAWQCGAPIIQTKSPVEVVSVLFAFGFGIALDVEKKNI